MPGGRIRSRSRDHDGGLSVSRVVGGVTQLLGHHGLEIAGQPQLVFHLFAVRDVRDHRVKPGNRTVSPNVRNVMGVHEAGSLPVWNFRLELRMRARQCSVHVRTNAFEGCLAKQVAHITDYMSVGTVLCRQQIAGPGIMAARRKQRHVAVLFLDLDRFKVVNDTLGHDIGDRILRMLGALLRRQVRESDYVIRWGGDEFLLLLTCSLAEAARKADELKRAFGRMGDSVVIGALVISHWVLDAIVHQPDLPVSPGNTFVLGLNVWSSLPLTLAIVALFSATGPWSAMAVSRRLHGRRCDVPLGINLVKTNDAARPPTDAEVM